MGRVFAVFLVRMSCTAGFEDLLIAFLWQGLLHIIRGGLNGH